MTATRQPPISRLATLLASALLALSVLGVGTAHGAPPTNSPQLGDRCIGADIGRIAIDSHGNSIVCDNYIWRLNRGQTPRHPWADEQTQWAECTAQHTVEWCREHLNGR